MLCWSHDILPIHSNTVINRGAAGVQAVEEVDRVVGSKQQPSMQDYSQLRYLTRCVCESMRLYPHPPVLLRRASIPDTLPGQSHPGFIGRPCTYVHANARTRNCRPCYGLHSLCLKTTLDAIWHWGEGSKRGRNVSCGRVWSQTCFFSQPMWWSFFHSSGSQTPDRHTTHSVQGSQSSSMTLCMPE